LEEALDVTLPERLLAGVRTYGELTALVLDRLTHPITSAAEPTLARVHVTPAGGTPLVRVVVLTPYVVETVTADARRSGHGTRLDVAVPAATREPVLAGLGAMFDALAAIGIQVAVGRDEQWTA
jgi:hypothetical protein